MKYVELGVGNKWLVRTEIELEDGTEREEKGIVGPIIFHSFYFRIWIGKWVIIMDSKEGVKRMKKTKTAIKMIVGITSMDYKVMSE
ncbi:DUF3977 family protein [Bacillus weihaiensis]|uniref:DUF3977 domain-containing protein n=1 Tax=Bacillus weihaiensis TaxID=1547283 RepID=A0A1L3MRE1_9BACI|nr:DUF3977 family protein [Bacillus weihaiensis]APH04903.1 hypothetical protein A9C19_09160 [Bacillus weihaiensis]